MSNRTLWLLVGLGLLGLGLGLYGIVMTGSFAVAGPAATEDARMAYWEGVQRWFDGLALFSTLLAGAGGAELARRAVRARTARMPGKAT